jgi:(p)ppGpp synthase/HD superfamily hydrolase
MTREKDRVGLSAGGTGRREEALMVHNADASPAGPSYLRRLHRARAAFEFVAQRHAGQVREADHAPFVLHPLEVGALLNVSGHSEQVVAAGLLHDVLEDSDTSTEELERCFGRDIARLVEAVSEDPSVDDEVERKARLRRQVAAAGPEAAAIFAADKLSKVRELRIRTAADAASAAEDATRRKVEHYLASRSMLERSLPGHPLVQELSFELEALLALPPAGVQVAG